MLKRFFDIVASFVGLVVTIPFYPFIALAIKLDSPGPVFYLQDRVGLKGKDFRILKFRTMATGADRQQLITGTEDSRITKAGRWLRRFELDELPTLFNVLKGEMSIVGPRPEAKRIVEHYTQEQRRVLSVRPGMTDLGTVRFRSEAKLLADGSDFEGIYLKHILPEKLKLNLEYIQRRNFFFDLYIIFSTLFLILRQKKV